MADKEYKFYIGIDVSKHKLDIAISSLSELLQITNNEAGIRELLKHLPSKKNSLITLEASGGYEKLAANYLRARRFNVAVVNAKRVRDFAKASGKLAKTDSIDAKVIMNFGKTFKPTAQALATPEGITRINYLNRRSQIVKMIATEKQHLEQTSKELRPHIQKHIKYLQQELGKIESLLKEYISQDVGLNTKVKRLDEIKGVGEVTAMNILLYMPELGQLTPKEASALAGVAPFNKESGQMKGKREIWGGRAPVRSALYMAILTAKKFNPQIKKFYERLIEKGKAKKVAMVACMRKLIIVMNAMIRDQSKWHFI